MDISYDQLKISPLFKNVPEECLNDIVEGNIGRVQTFFANEAVVFRRGKIASAMILVDGDLHGQLSYDNKFVLETIHKGSMILPDFLYAYRNTSPADIVTKDGCTVLFISKEDFSNLLCSNVILMENYLYIISSRQRLISDSVNYLAVKSIKAKYCSYILAMSERLSCDTFKMDRTQKELAQMFGVTRPALARAIGEVASDGCIYVDRKNITINYPEKLRQYIK